MRRFLAALRRLWGGGRARPLGLAVGIVSFDADEADATCISVLNEESVLGRLEGRLRHEAGIDFDGSDRSGSYVKWFFFGADVATLEATLVEALRSEPACRGARLRVSRHGLAGAWRETRI